GARIWRRAWRGQTRRRAGDAAGARAALAQAAVELAALDCPACAVGFQAVAAEEYAALGDADAALAAAAEAQRLGKTLGCVPARLAAHPAPAPADLAAGRPPAA